MVTCEATNVPHNEGDNCENPVPADHDGMHADCVPCNHIRDRRAVLTVRALNNPEGATPYEFTKGMLKADALQFWVDAKALGFVGVGQNKRGTKLFALPNYVAPK